jgi:hypothetical protein
MGIHRRRAGEEAELLALIDEAQVNAEAARMSHDARVSVGLSQSGLAELLSASQPLSPVWKMLATAAIH